jgi:chemotaxis protein histidine kinase CheA
MDQHAKKHGQPAAAPAASAGQGQSLDARIAAAQAAVAELGKQYLPWVRDDLVKAREALAAIRAGGDQAQPINDIFMVAHNIKGQAGSFGFDLLSAIGDLLCTLTRERKSANEGYIAVLTAHLDALDFVVAREISGNGGDEGIKLLTNLKTQIASIPR